MLIFGDRQLVPALSEYEHHDNTHRPHRAWEQRPPIADVGLDRADGNGAVRRTEIRLINEYRHAA